jgi:hypothetical protein
VALIVEIHHLERRIPRTLAGVEAESDRARTRARIMAALFIFAMAALTISEAFCLRAATGSELHGIAETIVWGALGFAMVVTFLLPPVAWFWRLFTKAQRGTIALGTLGAIGAIGLIFSQFSLFK